MFSLLRLRKERMKYNEYRRSYAIYRNRIPTSGNLWQPLARLAGTGKRAPHAPKTCNLTWDDHRNPLRPKIQLGGAPRSCARTCQRLPEVAGAGARGRQSSNAFKAKVFAQSLRKACLAKIPIQAWCYRPRLLAGAFGLVWGYL